LSLRFCRRGRMAGESIREANGDEVVNGYGPVITL
jgi:hypothetical protein